MNCLISLAVVILSITFAIVGGRSASLPETKGLSSQNVIVLESSGTGDGPGAGKALLGGDKVLIEGKNFTNLKEMINILDEEKKGKDIATDSTPEPFTLVVPIARNFSSLKELFEILREDGSQPPKTASPTNLTFVEGTEDKDSEYMIFFTS
ncbi:uncharacterized protein LOC124354842 [Homalodisca vitripennis]|uniref:uncharacterized protein LOC124354842 n=1 Tax=Homalodisca vitripennis TaxID=197043 RepID=UPI001EEAB0AA|nr:uncharacterized protein LOC124354842 [Homalodisca vitripennis]